MDDQIGAKPVSKLTWGLMSGELPAVWTQARSPRHNLPKPREAQDRVVQEATWAGSQWAGGPEGNPAHSRDRTRLFPESAYARHSLLNLEGHGGT